MSNPEDSKEYLRKHWPAYVEAYGEEAVWAGFTAINQTFAAWGLPVPEDLRALQAPLARKIPLSLVEVSLGSHVPTLDARTNVAEQRILQAQRYAPLWAEIFGNLIELGSTSVGDLWMYGYDPASAALGPVYLYNQERAELEGIHAKDLDAWFFHSVVATEQSAGPPANADESSIHWMAMRRARWLVTLLSKADPSDLEIRRAFDSKLNPPLTEALVKARSAQFHDFPSSLAYSCLAAFFFGDDARLEQTLELAHAQKPSPASRGWMALIEALREGRKELGVLRDVPELRARVIALELWGGDAGSK